MMISPEIVFIQIADHLWSRQPKFKGSGARGIGAEVFAVKALSG